MLNRFLNFFSPLKCNDLKVDHFHLCLAEDFSIPLEIKKQNHTEMFQKVIRKIKVKE